MPRADPPTPETVADLVLANRAIRAPKHEAEHDEGVEFSEPEKGLQWGADVVPALLGLFDVARDPRTDHPEGWLGLARHWRGATLRVAFDLFTDDEERDPTVVVTETSGRAGEGTIDDAALGTVELPDAVPTESAWAERVKRYESARRRDDADGAASVRAWIAALPGWQGEVAGRFDALIEREVPEVRRAVRWHQPFYGVEDRGWFAAFSAFTRHVKLTFVAEAPLEPQPPTGTGPTRQALDVTAADELDEVQVADWLRQAAAEPGMAW